MSGLRFMAWKMGALSFSEVLQTPAVHAYAVNPNATRDRREAPPFPLVFVAALERRVADPSSELPEVLFLGGLLCCIWAGLRFGDAQRCRPDSVTLEQGVLRGNCWRTKTSRSGQPWGCLACGASGTSGSDWGARWLGALREFWGTPDPEDSPDFLIPDVIRCRRSGALLLLRRPMGYASALCTMRAAIRSTLLGASPSACRAFSLHSAKVTTLSWARQLCCPEEWRREQGHH